MRSKTLGVISLFFVVILTITGCTETESINQDGEVKTEFQIDEVATVNDTEITINSVTKVLSECSYEYDGECWYETNPDNDFFIVIDVTIKNNGDDELSISSMMSFSLKDENGEKGSYGLLTESISSQLDDSIMPGDSLKGQIAYDVNDSEYYNFYYQDSLLDDSIKFVINNSDIIS